MRDYGLGRLPPPDFDHVAKYPHLRAAAAPQVCERNVPFSSEWRRFYDQGPTSECVAFSTCEERSVRHRVTFDPHWLYRECKKRDGYPNEDGTFMRVAFDVLREEGLKPLTMSGPNPAFMVPRNEWLTSIDAIRAAVATSATGVLFASNWYERMFDPEKRHNHYWLPEGTAELGALAGGHQYWFKGVSDRLGGFLMPNSWGQSDRDWHPEEPGWPVTVMPYSLAERLLREDGECGIVIEAAP